jgi:hypothetical protein
MNIYQKPCAFDGEKRMNIQQQNSAVPSIFKAFALTILVFSFLSGCSMVFEFFEKAPIEDGSYVSYYCSEGYWVTVDFSKISGDQFYAYMETEYEDEALAELQTSNPVRDKVNKRLKKENGFPYDAEILGPMWTPPSSVKQGGTIHGSYIDEVKKWEDWEVGVIKASFGRGAITGTWYYDKETGFLVGGSLATVMDVDANEFVLVDTNIDSLM